MPTLTGFAVTADHGRLSIADPPEAGALIPVSTELLAELQTQHGVEVDADGRLHVLGLVLEPVAFQAGPITHQVLAVVCRRVA